MTTKFEVAAGTIDTVPELRAVFLALHQHHRGVSRVELTEPDETAWNERQNTYLRHFAAGDAVLYVARPVGGGPVIGYAFALIHDGDNDTFPLGSRFAELYTLAVLPQYRNGGIGGALMDSVEGRLRSEGISNLTVAVMVDNDSAIRFYRRRGLIPGELVLYRIDAPYGRRPA